MVSGYGKDMQGASRRRGNPGKRAVARLHKWLQDGQKLTQDPDLPLELGLGQIISPDDLARALKYVEEAQKKTSRKRYPYKAHHKMMAAGEAYNLLKQFNKEIIAEKGSVFCRLAALLYGQPRVSLRWTCRGVLARAKARAAN